MLVMLCVVLDATRRTVFARAILGLTDAERIMLAWIACAGLAYALVTGTHVRVTLFVRHLPTRARLACEIFGETLGAAFFTFFVVLLWPYSWQSWLIKEIPMGPVPMPIWLAKLAIAIGTTFIMFEFWLRLIRKLSNLKLKPAEDN